MEALPAELEAKAGTTTAVIPSQLTSYHPPLDQATQEEIQDEYHRHIEEGYGEDGRIHVTTMTVQPGNQQVLIVSGPIALLEPYLKRSRLIERQNFHHLNTV